MSTLPALIDWAAKAPEGVRIPAELVARLGSEFLEGLDGIRASEVGEEPITLTWRERLWLVPAETRLGVREVAEALGRSTSWLYRHTGPKCDSADLIPHRKLEGELVFTAGEVRAWVRDREDVLAAGRMEPCPFEKRLYVVPGGAA